MSVELELFGDLAFARQTIIAHKISAYTKGLCGEVPQMLPLEPEDLHNKQLGLVALQNGVFIGYVGATQPKPHGDYQMSEVGSLWVAESHRKQGIARKLVETASKVLLSDEQVPYAFCNPLSKGVFAKSGYLPSDTAMVPPSALHACISCPMRPLAGCCDEIMVHKGVSQ